MYLIVGLGNPEPEYSKTRHNMGFDVINKLSAKYEIEVKKEKFNGLFGSGVIEGRKSNIIKATNIYERKWRMCGKVC